VDELLELLLLSVVPVLDLALFFLWPLCSPLSVWVSPRALWSLVVVVLVAL